MFGVDCASGDTFTDGTCNLTMVRKRKEEFFFPTYSMYLIISFFIAQTTMFVPKPVISLSIEPKGRETPNFAKALARFQREDPTFKVHVDNESKQTIISGMGELHLEIYLERMKREYGVSTVTGKPQVAFRETIQSSAKFSYTHKKQSGGSGQYAKVMGYIEPVEKEEIEVDEESSHSASSSSSATEDYCNEFEDATVGMNIPSNYIPAVEKVRVRGHKSV